MEIELQPFEITYCKKCGHGEIEQVYYRGRDNALVQINGDLINSIQFEEFIFCTCKNCGYEWLSKVYEPG